MGARVSDVMYWIDPDGVVTNLTDSGTFEVLWGVEGRFMPPVKFVEDEVPEKAGTVLRYAQFGPREVVLPIEVVGTDEETLRTLLRSTLGLFNPKRGDGTLRVVGPDGAARELVCRYRSGMEMRESLQEAGRTWQRAGVVLKAFDPYWYDENETVEAFGTTTAEFFPFPFTLAVSTIFETFEVQNTGDVESWPVWTITGPGEDPVFTNVTTGESLTLTTTLADGDEVVIDTRPRRKTITKNGTTNLYSALDPAGSLWPLVQGTNEITLDMGGATPDSQIAVSFKRAYLGA
jgi:phage-related protein